MIANVTGTINDPNMKFPVLQKNCKIDEIFNIHVIRWLTVKLKRYHGKVRKQKPSDITVSM